MSMASISNPMLASTLRDTVSGGTTLPLATGHCGVHRWKEQQKLDSATRWTQGQRHQGQCRQGQRQHSPSIYILFIDFLILILYDYARRAPFQAPSANVTATRVKEEGPWKKLGHQASTYFSALALAKSPKMLCSTIWWR